MSKQRAHWAITIKEETYATWSPKARAEFDKYVGKYIRCQGERMLLHYDRDLSYMLAIGMKEREDDATSSTHWHCLFSCMPGKTCTAGRVRVVMGMNYMTMVDEYLQQLDTNPMTYMKYANKAGTEGRQRDNVDGILRDDFNMLKQKSVVSKDVFVTYLCDKYGATWVTKNKSIIDTFCSIQELCYAERIVMDVDDDKDIEERVVSIVSSFHDNVLEQIRRPGALQTHCEALKDVSTDDIAKYITIVSMLPYMFQRAKNAIDFIPGLYFWGEANAGKSFIFQLGKAYRTIAADSVGVGKFKLETCEAAFLLDDVKGDAVDTGSYISTLRQLTLGAYTRIKIHSETKQIKGFVAVTSNDKPDFLQGHYDEKNRVAWLRRFIVVEFKRDSGMDELVVNGNEFEYKVAQGVLAKGMIKLSEYLMEVYGGEHRINKSIAIYMKHMSKYLISTIENIDDDGARPILDSDVGHFDQPQMITAANRIEPKKEPTAVVEIEDSSSSISTPETTKKRQLVYDYLSDSDGFSLSNGKRVKLVKTNSQHFMR